MFARDQLEALRYNNDSVKLSANDLE